MKTKYLKWVYMIITSISLFMCALLLWTVFSAEKTTFHAPPGVIIAAQRGNTIITEKYLTSGISEILPDNFPLTDFTVKICNEQIIISAQLTKSEVRNWVKANAVELGFKQNLALSFMPKKINAQLSVDISADEMNIALSNVQLYINSSHTQIPNAVQELIPTLTDGINKMLKDSGIKYSKIAIDDGFIELIS